MKTHPNQAAFTEGTIGRNNTLTKREYFAALIMQSMCASDQPLSQEVLRRAADNNISIDEISATAAVASADALIRALNETSND